jgi:hypothetical protein
VVRGDRFTVRVLAPEREAVVVVWGVSGESARRTEASVSAGISDVSIGPIGARTRYWAEDAHGQATDTFEVVPLDPLMITDTEAHLRYPDYLERAADEVPGPVAALTVPEGTVVDLRGRTNHPVREAELQLSAGAGGERIPLVAKGTSLRGEFMASRSGLLSWRAVPAGSVPGIRMPPPIDLAVVSDEAPEVAVTYPGQSLTLGMDGLLTVVVEARDDHGIHRLHLVWWRESAAGVRDSPVRVRLDDGSGRRRATARRSLDLAAQGLLPGDALVYHASASDANPVNPAVMSETFRVEIATLADARAEAETRVEALATEARALNEQVDRLTEEARAAERRATGDIETDRPRPGAERADFASTEQARELLREARAMEEAVRTMADGLREMRQDLDATALPDPTLRAELEQLEDLYREILQSGLAERIQDLEQALRELDRETLREAVSSLTRDAETLDERLERALGLMERVALEQSLKGAGERAGELGDRQGRMASSETTDEEWVRKEKDLAAEAESLARDLESLAARLDAKAERNVGDMTRRAKADMERAASELSRAGSEAGKQVGVDDSERAPPSQAAEALEALEQAERQLAAAGETLARDWKSEAIAAVERATQEALELAREQSDLVERLRSGEQPQSLQGREAALRQGLDNLTQGLGEAGKKTALLDRRAGAAAARAGEQMDATSQSLAAGAARRGAAVEGGEAAVEALSDLAGTLVASRGSMAEAGSGTGMEEALERLARLGQRQAGLNGETGELFLLMQGGEPAGAQLEALAGRQRQLARELEELAGRSAAGELAGRPEELAAEAEELARRMSGGGLDRQTLARQERLFRRLLDAGRTLQRDDDDPRRRESATASRTGPVVDPETDPAVLAGPRYPYPAESDLKGLTGTQRRMVYEYFDRLNADDRGTGDRR